VPAAARARATVLGLPNERFHGPGLGEGFRREVAAAFARAGRPGAEGMDLLAISGGGEDGAFGAGLLTAWEPRPRFRLVTGVSTGALTAPFAFLGPGWDAGLEEVYTRVTFADIARRRWLPAAIFDDAMADTAPLFRTISRLLDERMMAAIAAGYAEGRLLLVGTTNLDDGSGCIWNLGAIAASGHPRALETIRRVLLASSAIPGAFPPVLFDVEADGARHQELHVDGGAIAQTFLYPAALSAERRVALAAGRPVPPIRAWVIRNGRLGSQPASTERRTVTIAQRAVQTMIGASGYFDAQRIWLTTQRDAVQYRLAFIGEDFDTPYEAPFEPAYMRALFAYAQARMRAGTAWHEAPPGMG
jgi:predicted acylesterase/phospholipase RssA